jgi:soluble lytic murein transglycosylase-like protein
LIQFAHKRANNNFNDIVAQLYQQEFKTQEKAKYEHIRQAKERALEENKRRVEAENENEGGVPNTATSDTIGSDWSSVSPEIAASYMSSKTGVSAGKWLDVIYKESSGNPYVTNPIGCYGLLQINQNSHGNVSGMTPQEYLDKAVSIYQGSGGTAWVTW